MGGGLARNLIKAGKEVLVFDLSAEAVQKTIAAGKTGKAVKEIKEMAGADVVFTSLPLPTDVEGVMLGEKGLLGVDEARIDLHRCEHHRSENRPEAFRCGGSPQDPFPGMSFGKDPGPRGKGRGADFCRREEGSL